MSESGEAAPVIVEEVEQDVTTVDEAIQRVLRNSIGAGGCYRGLHEVAKLVESKAAKLVFLAESCSEEPYKRLVTALCKERDIPCVSVADKKALGEWAGLCKMDRDGNARKVVGASSVAIVEFGDEESQALHFLLNAIRDK